MDINTLLKKVYDSTKNNKQGKVASYIPELKKVDSTIYGITIMDCVTGKLYSIGNYNTKVALESVSKLFTLAMAVEKFGINIIIKKIGIDVSPFKFNSVIAEELSKNHTINPFVNQGAIATTSLFYNKNLRKFKKIIIDNIRSYAGVRLKVGKSILHSESTHNFTNLALAYLLKSHNRFYGDDIPKTVNVYTKQCSLLVSSQDLATMGSVFANKGVHVKTNKQFIKPKNVNFILNILKNEGLYEYSESWVVQTDGRAAAKSGVGGCLLIIIPELMFSIGIVSPKLDSTGNSVRGIKAGVKLVKLLYKYRSQLR